VCIRSKTIVFWVIDTGRTCPLIACSLVIGFFQQVQIDIPQPLSSLYRVTKNRRIQCNCIGDFRCMDLSVFRNLIDNSPDHNLRTCTAIGMVSTEFNSESNAKSIGARTASDGEFVFSTTAKASKDEASHDCRGRIRAEFDRLVRTATPIEFFRSVSETPEGGILPVEPSADVRKMPNTQLAR
jgi:hypothetical protein